MNSEKASTLRLLKEGMGKTVNVVGTRGRGSFHEVKAHLPDCAGESFVPILFLISSLSFLESGAAHGEHGADFREEDGWTLADFVSYLRFEGTSLCLTLATVRGRGIFTDIILNSRGNLTIRTRGRGQSAGRWLTYVQGRSHLQRVTLSS